MPRLVLELAGLRLELVQVQEGHQLPVDTPVEVLGDLAEVRLRKRLLRALLVDLLATEVVLGSFPLRVITGRVVVRRSGAEGRR